MNMRYALLPLLGLAAIAALGACSQETLPEQDLVIEGHKFTPAEITISAGQKVRIKVENRDDASEEFDSDSLGREKVVPAKSSGFVVIGPLAAGKYPFQGEFHHETAQGMVIVQ